MPKPSISIPSLNAKPRHEPTTPLSPSLSPAASSNSPMSSPPSPYKSTIRPVTGHKKSAAETLASTGGDYPLKSGEKADDIVQHSVTAIPQLPPSPLEQPKAGRDGQKSFFANLKASKSTHKIQSSAIEAPSPSEQPLPRSRGSSRERLGNLTSRGNQSTPDLPATSSSERDAARGQCLFFLCPGS